MVAEAAEAAAWQLGVARVEARRRQRRPTAIASLEAMASSRATTRRALRRLRQAEAAHVRARVSGMRARRRASERAEAEELMTLDELVDAAGEPPANAMCTLSELLASGALDHLLPS